MSSPERRSAPFADLAYTGGWLAVAVALGFATYLGVITNPAVAPPDRVATDNQKEPGESVEATEVLITSIDPKTNDKLWELRVPQTAGGITSKTTLESPTLVIYMEGRPITITAASGTLREAPVGEQHTASNVQLHLSGPIAGASENREEWFEADEATWEGPTRRLALTGAPLTVFRDGMQVQAYELLVDYSSDTSPVYTLKGSVHLESGR